MNAVKAYGRSRPSDLSKITQPALIANGDHDRMVPSALSEDLHRRIAGSELILYPNSGHGGIFQYHEQFAPTAVKFLADLCAVQPSDRCFALSANTSQGVTPWCPRANTATH